MTKQIKLAVLSRQESDKNPKETRSEGYIPGVVYGNNLETIQIKIKNIDFQKAFEKAGESTLIDLSIDDEKSAKVIIKEVQFHPIKNRAQHVDFYQVDMKNKIDVEIPLSFVNESILEKDSSVTLVKNMETVEVSCLPGDLIESIDVDMSKMQKVGDAIRVEDLDLSENFEIVSALSDVIISASETRVSVEEDVKPEEAVEAEKPADNKVEEKKS